MHNLYQKDKAVFDKIGMSREQLWQGAGIELADIPSLKFKDAGFYGAVVDVTSSKYEKLHYNVMSN